MVLLRRLSLLLALITLASVICACAQTDVDRYSFAAEPGAPGVQGLPDAAVQSVSMQLYFVSQDGARLVPESRTIEISPYESRAAAAVKQLLEGPQSASLRRVFWPGTSLISLESARGVTTINLSETFEQMFASDRTLAKAALIQTLNSLDGTRYLNVLSGGREPGYDGKPTGVTEYFTEDYDLYQSRLSQRLETQQTDAAPGTTYSTERVNAYMATLYFADVSGRFLLPEVRNITVSDLGYAEAIIEELQSGPSPLSGLRATLPGFSLAEASRVRILESGRNQIDIALTGPQEGQALAIASIVCSLGAFIPTNDHLSISLNGAAVTSLVMPGAGAVEFRDGMLSRESFVNLIGTEVPLCFANASGALTRISRTMSQSEAMNPDFRIQELLKGPQHDEAADILPVLPGADPNDVPHVTISGDMAWIDCSRTFAAAAAELEPDAGFLLMYALINTVCEFPDVKRVQFLVEGESADSLSGSVYIRTPLLKNPGLIQE